MKKNMGRPDRYIRTVIACLIAFLYFAHVITGVTAIVLAIIGGIFLLTSLIGFCPLYILIGLNTKATKVGENH